MYRVFRIYVPSSCLPTEKETTRKATNTIHGLLLSLTKLHASDRNDNLTIALLGQIGVGCALHRMRAIRRIRTVEACCGRPTGQSVKTPSEYDFYGRSALIVLAPAAVPISCICPCPTCASLSVPYDTHPPILVSTRLRPSTFICFNGTYWYLNLTVNRFECRYEERFAPASKGATSSHLDLSSKSTRVSVRTYHAVSSIDKMQ